MRRTFKTTVIENKKNEKYGFLFGKNIDDNLRKIKRRIILDCGLRIGINLIVIGLLLMFLGWLIEVFKANSVLF